jgi:hypothetical protein
VSALPVVLSSWDSLSSSVARHSEQDLTRQVTLYKSQLRELRLSNETNQARLLDASSRADQDLVSRLAEADMVLADLERANGRVAVVEGRNVRPAFLQCIPMLYMQFNRRHYALRSKY